MTQFLCLRRLRGVAATGLLCVLAFCAGPASAQGASYVVPSGMLAGMTRSGPASGTHPLHVAVELEPKDAALDSLAAAVADPASTSHRNIVSAQAFAQRFGRQSDIETIAALLRASGGNNVYVAGDLLVVGATMTIAQAERAFHTTFAEYVMGGRTGFAPVRPLALPVRGIRAVRGVVGVSSPRLADVTPTFTNFRGNWYAPQRFREAYDAVEGGGEGQRVALIEAESDRFLQSDLVDFLKAPDAPAGASASRLTTHGGDGAAQNARCGRDDRGQEPTVDVDALLTMAPLAAADLRYEDVCELGDEGTIALARALDDPNPPTVIVFPFVVAPVTGATRESFGPIPLVYLEAVLRGIPIVVPSGDDGAYGMRLPGQERAAVSYPCVLPYVICAGGTELGDRSGVLDEAPWNDGVHASGGGISADPRPGWQLATGGFEFSPAYARTRMVPDVSADAAGHLLTYWHGYTFGGVGGTSESAAVVGAQLAAINAVVPPAKRLLTAGDLYALQRSAPDAVRDVVRENDRGYRDNTLRPRGLPLPLDYKGIVPPPPPTAKGCSPLQADGCTVGPGYDAVTGIGSLRERAAIAALK